jgi:hypothetical protein
MFEFILDASGSANANWELAYKSDNPHFFVAAYGATRRVEQKSDFAINFERRSSFARASRLESVMREGFPLISLRSWLPQKKKSKRRDQIFDLINRLLGKGHFQFYGKTDKEDNYLFIRNGMEIPVQCLSDGYRGYLGWIADLLHHLDFACSDQSLDLTHVNGIVLVDEIDLHLHPEWQMEVIQTISKTFPRIQFIFTSHSPLIAGSVEWMNIKHLRLDNQHRTGIDPFRTPVHGLDADQILLTSLFGLKTTRAKKKYDELERIRVRALSGDDEAARLLMWKLAEGMEER